MSETGHILRGNKMEVEDSYRYIRGVPCSNHSGRLEYHIDYDSADTMIAGYTVKQHSILGKELNKNIKNPCSVNTHRFVTYYDGDMVCCRCGWLLAYMYSEKDLKKLREESQNERE